MSYDNAELERLSAFLDGRLDRDETRQVQERLNTCDDYRALHEQLKSARQVLRSAPDPAPPAGLLAQIKSDAAAEMAPGAGTSIWERWRAPVGAFAAAAALLLAVFSPWQATHRDDLCQVDAPAETEAMVVESSPVPPGEDAAAREEAPTADVAEVTVDALPSEEASEAVSTTRPESPPTRVARAVRSSPPPSGAPDEMSRVEPEETSAGEPPAPEPQLAAVPTGGATLASGTGPLLSEPRDTPTIARAPRITIEDEPKIGGAGPSSGVESEMMAGVVAGVVLDQFVARNMVETSTTMLSVVTDMPTSELGPSVGSDDDETGSFGFSFTDAMRRALSESENQVP
ncbi:MAG: hypothetical protein R6V07_14420 [Armatimonadota bacterium]